MKKIIFILAILISLVAFFFIIANLVDSHVSYKYEIDEPPGIDYIDIELASGYLIGKIRCLEFFLCYVVVSIVLFLYSISNNKNK